MTEAFDRPREKAARKLHRRTVLAQPDLSPFGITVVRQVEAAAPRPRPAPIVSGVPPRQFGFWSSVMAPFAGDTINGGLALLSASCVSVAGHSGTLIFDGAWIDAEQSQFADVSSPGSLIQMEQAGEPTFTSPMPARHVGGEYLMGFNPGRTNYAHWMTDHLPSIVYFRDHLKAEGSKLILPRCKESHFSMQAIRLLGLTDRDIFYIEDEVVEFETLSFFSYFGFDRLPDAAATALASLKATVRTERSPPTRRLFVSRPDSRSRRLLNEDIVFDHLSDLGFSKVAPGLMSVEEQIETFDAAAIVVGPHGAGLVNAGFCRPGTALLELFSEYTLQPHFWNIATLGDVRYGFVCGTSFDQDAALWDPNGSWDGPFVLDPKAVVQGVRALGF